MRIAQRHHNLVNLISNTQQILKVDDLRRGNSFEKVIQIKAEQPFQKTITFYFDLKPYHSKVKLFPLLDFTRNKVGSIAELKFLTLMIRNNEYKYYYNFEEDYINHLSPIQLEKKFQSTWLELETKIKSHYAL